MSVPRARSLAYWEQHVSIETHDHIFPGRPRVPAEKQASLADHCRCTGHEADTST
ncbi:hypothetical protein ACFWAY_47335 [Rhodococcus sp. NPDC059968]|uniref:hypothetical protein n=1 Tax=Rhodococcus sp. NPDC059968 TaxID=3347017 RepID=UPI00366FB3C4